MGTSHIQLCEIDVCIYSKTEVAVPVVIILAMYLLHSTQMFQKFLSIH